MSNKIYVTTTSKYQDSACEPTKIIEHVIEIFQNNKKNISNKLLE